MRRRKRKNRAGDKSSAQRKHAKMRASQRYKLEINRHLYSQLIDNIKSKRGVVHIEKQSHRVTTYLLKVWEDWYPVVYDKVRGEIVTFLPPAYLDEVNLDFLKDEVRGLARKGLPYPERFYEPEVIPEEPKKKKKKGKPAQSPPSGYPTVRVVGVGQWCTIINSETKSKRLAGVLGVVDRGDREPPGYSEVGCPKTIASFNTVSQGPTTVTREDIEQLVDKGWEIILNLKPEKNQIVACYGVEKGSRSAAIAYIFWCMLKEEGQEDVALQLFIENCKKKLKPHRKMVELADEILGREGRMIAAWEKKYNGGSSESGVHLDRRDEADSEVEVEDESSPSDTLITEGPGEA